MFPFFVLFSSYKQHNELEIVHLVHKCQGGAHDFPRRWFFPFFLANKELMRRWGGRGGGWPGGGEWEGDPRECIILGLIDLASPHYVSHG
jgi:hypothetical protein